MPVKTLGTSHNNPEQADYWHPHYAEIEPTLEYLKDMYIGSRRWLSDDGVIKDAEKASYYLPKASAQEPEEYLAQVRMSIFSMFFQDAIKKDIAGALLDFELTDQAKELIGPYVDNVDMQGTSLYVFIQNLVSAAIRDGSAFVFVDKAPVPEGSVTTLADARSANNRPYLVLYERCEVPNWRRAEEAPRHIEMIALRETVMIGDGKFGQAEKERYRYLYADGKYEVYESDSQASSSPKSQDTPDTLKLITSGEYDANMFPVVALSFGGTDPFYADFPLIEVADLTLDHYRVRSGYRTTLSFMDPTLVAKEPQSFAADESAQSKKVKVGANSVIWNLDMDWLEPRGGGIEPKERCLNRIEAKIEKKTLAFYSGAAPKTATEVELDAAQSESTLGTFASRLESTVAEIFKIFADYLGASTDDAGSIVVNREIVNKKTPWTPQVTLEWLGQGVMPLELGYRILRETDGFPQSITEEEFNEYLAMAQSGGAIAIAHEGENDGREV